MKRVGSKILWYFAHPYYNKSQSLKAKNHNLCMERTLKLIELGYRVFSPIIYSVPLDVYINGDHDFWLDFDLPFMRNCEGLILAPKWEVSKGCNFEYEDFIMEKKPIKFYEDIINGHSCRSR